MMDKYIDSSAPVGHLEFHSESDAILGLLQQTVMIIICL